jgi:hypothetical protein
VLRLFSKPVCFNGRLVLIGDGIKVPKRGKQMPGVKRDVVGVAKESGGIEWSFGRKRGLEI